MQHVLNTIRRTIGAWWSTLGPPPNSFGDAEHSRGLPAIAVRFAYPIGGIGLGLAAWLAAWLWPSVGSHLVRLGTTLLIIGLLWVVAIGFALGTLRLVAAVAAVVIVFLLTDIGGRARNRIEATEHRSLQSELEIELNLLRGVRTTRAEVAEKLEAAMASADNGELASGVAELAVTNLEAWRTELVAITLGAPGQPISPTTTTPGPPSTVVLGDEFDDEDPDVALAIVDSYRRVVSALTASIETQVAQIGPTIAAGWDALDLDPPADRRREPARPSTTQPTPEGSPPGPTTTVADPAVLDPRADELAIARARRRAREAELAADRLDATVGQLRLLLTELSNQGLTADYENRPDDRPTVGLPLPLRRLDEIDVNLAEPGPRCIDPGEEQLPPTFDEVAAAANQCIAGCFDTDRPATCQPRQASRILLLGFQEQLVILTEREDITENQQQLVARLDEIRAQQASLDEPVAIHSLAIDGADVLLGEAVQLGTLEGDQPARLGGWGWLVITIAVIIGYRLLEIANDSRTPGPVKVVAGEGGDPSPETRAAAELVRSHLAAADLQEPSPLPGGEAVSSISSATEATGVENVLVKFMVSLLQTTAFPRRGVEVVVSTQPARGADDREGSDPDDGAGQRSTKPLPVRPVDAPYRILVRASTTRRNGLLFSHPFVGQELEEVTHAAGYFAAERLLDAGWTTPSWLNWSSHNGSALRAYQEVMIEKQSPSHLVVERPAETRRQRLSRAVTSSPGTGAALLALSHEAVLEEDFATALHLLLLARIRHPRFLTARYRLGVTLSMMAPNLDRYWRSGPTDSQHANQIAGSLDVLEDLDPRWTRARRHGADRPRLLLELAQIELDFVIDAVTLPRTVLRACRQDERQYWLGLARSGRRRTALAAGALSARALARRRLHAVFGPGRLGSSDPFDEPPGWLTLLADCDADNEMAIAWSPDDWLVRYNAACYSAIRCAEHHQAQEDLSDRAERETDSRLRGELATLAGLQRNRAETFYQAAFDHLRRARYARNGQQLFVRWVHVDPDLEPLRVRHPSQWSTRLGGIFQLTEAEAAEYVIS